MVCGVYFCETSGGADVDLPVGYVCAAYGWLPCLLIRQLVFVFRLSFLCVGTTF